MYKRQVYPLYASLREKLSRMNSVAQENIAGNKTVRAFVREAYENEKFENCNEEYRQANLKACLLYTSNVYKRQLHTL